MKNSKLSHIIGTPILTLMVGSLLVLFPSVTASNEGSPGGPFQIPDQDPGCHFPNSAGKANGKPTCEGEEFGPPIPDCEAADNVETNSCRPSSGHLD